MASLQSKFEDIGNCYVRQCLNNFLRVIKATYIVFPSGIVHFVIYLFCMQSMLICRMLRDFFDGLWGCGCVGGGKPEGEGRRRRGT